MESSFTVLRVRGIPIGVTWSWLVIFGLVVWSLSQALFPATYPGFSGSTYLMMGLVTAGLFFASVVLHELGHALRAVREGMAIKGITLFLFGGVARLDGAPPSPRVEFHVAICGPVVTVAVAGGFLGAAVVGDGLGWPGTVQGVIDYVGRINLLVLGFNLIPALPLDGGRVLRAWLWRRQQSFPAATRSAALVGQAFGWMLVVIGLAGLLGGAGGSAFGGLWSAVIGWFLIGAARAERDDALARQASGEFGDDRGARSAGVLVWVVVAFTVVVAAAALYRPPYVVVAPGETSEVSPDIRIRGVPVDDLNGRYLMTTVSVGQRSALATLWSALRGDREVIALSDYLPSGVERSEYRRVQRQVFVESRQLAAAAAARAVGLPVDVSGTGAEVVRVVEGSPAEGILRPGDVIVDIDGESIGTATDLAEAIRSRPVGTDLAVVVERDGGRQTHHVVTEELPDVAGRVGIGVLIETRGLAVDLPFEIAFEQRDVGGPSAGLAYGLAIADLLDQGDFALGRTIAATGTISLDGEVGPVGGVEQKAAAVNDAGADVFFVPQGEVRQASGEDVPVRGVDRLEEALSFLRVHA